MQYMGSKRAIASDILPTMLKERKSGQYWVEPFVGGANMIERVTENRIGNDNNPYLIALLSAVRDGWVPPTEVSRDMYYAVKKQPETHPLELVGFIGFLCSFGGKWWGGYAHNKKGHNYALRGSNCLVKLGKKLRGVTLYCVDYRNLVIPSESLIYCDPPYANSTQYTVSFDHVAFYRWCRLMAVAGNTVFVSEVAAPADLICVAEVQTRGTLNRNSQCRRTERLFRVPSN